MPKLGIAAYEGADLLPHTDRWESLKKTGYDCIDLSILSDTGTPMFTCSETVLKEKVYELRRDIEKAGLMISQTHGPWQWPPKDATPAERDERLEKMSRALKITNMLGCKNMVIHPIMPTGSVDSGEQREENYRLNTEFFKKLLRVAEAEKTVLCLENMPMRELGLAPCSEILKFVKLFNSPYFKVCLDTGHCAVLGDSPADAVRLIGKDYLAVLHIHDNDGTRDQHLQPFCGVIDWEAFKNALAEINFAGTLSLETSPKILPTDDQPTRLQKTKTLFERLKKLNY